MATEIQELSPQAKEVLQRNAELRQKDSKFIKIEPVEKKSIAIQSRENRAGGS